MRRVLATFLLLGLCARGFGAEKVVVRWNDLPVAKLLQKEMRGRGEAFPEIEVVNSYAWARQQCLGFLCAADVTPDGFFDVPVALTGTIPYVTKTDSTNRLSIAEVRASIVAKEQCLVPDVKMPLRALVRKDGGYDYVPYGTSGGRLGGVRLGYEQFGGILAAGEFEKRTGLVFCTKTEAGRVFGAALAEAANRLGPERLIKPKRRS